MAGAIQRKIQERSFRPWEKLTKVVDKWNQLLTLCEERILVAEKHPKTAVDLGAQILLNLDKFRKKVKGGSPEKV